LANNKSELTPFYPHPGLRSLFSSFNEKRLNTDHAYRTNRSKTNHTTCCHTKAVEGTEGCYEHANGFLARLRNWDQFPKLILAVYNQLNYKVQIRGGNNGDKHGVSGDLRDVI